MKLILGTIVIANGVYWSGSTDAVWQWAAGWSQLVIGGFTIGHYLTE
jgi:hypothetical protein